MDEEIKDASALSLLSLQEASASFAEWERLMKGPRPGAAATDSPFTQVIGLVTQMYKQTAIAKVTGEQVVSERVLLYCSDVLYFYESD